jgi:hypothetical protein
VSRVTPRTLGDVTPEWLARALGREIESFELTPLGEGEGFMGLLARLRVTSPDPEVPASLIVKLPNPDPGAQAIGQMMRVWEREHGFYEHAAEHMTIRVPKAFVNVGDPPCLVLEDLAPSTPGDHVAGATVSQAERAIDLLARHHASWWQHPLLDTFHWMPGLDDPQIDMVKPVFDMGWPMFRQRYETELPARTLGWCERFVEQIPEWIAGHRDEPITLVHGDFRLDNLFFDDGPTGTGEVSVIDWQTSMRAPGGTDLVYFCANNLTVEMRRTHERALLDRYLDGLHRHGVPPDQIDRERVWQGYLEGLLFYAMSFGGSLLTLNPANERGAALFDALVRRTFAAVDDLDAGHALGFAD